MDRLLRIGEASKVLGVSITTLRRWEKEGKIKPYRIGKERNKLKKVISELKNERANS